MGQYQVNGVTMYRGTLDENKAERVEEVKQAFVGLCDGAYPDLQMQLAGLRSLPRPLFYTMRAQGIAALERRQELIAEVNACTTIEEVWAVNIDFTNLNPQTTHETNYAHVSGAPNTVLSNAEATIASVTITPSHANARIRIEASVELTKDTGTTVRTATLRIRKGANQVGQQATARSWNVASTIYAPRTIIEIDAPNTTDPVTYTLRGILDGGASTATRGTLTATEI